MSRSWLVPISHHWEMNIKIYLVPILMAVMGFPNVPYSIAASTGSGAAVAVSPQSTNREAQMPPKPEDPKECLMRLKSAFEQSLFLQESFYSDENLKRFFGERFTFTSLKDKPGKTHLVFDDMHYVVDIDERGNPTPPPGQNRLCLQGGSITFVAGGNGRKAWASMGLVTSARFTVTSSFYAGLVKEIFGTPSSITEGFPTGPPLHGYAYIPETKTHDLGNSWINYQKESLHTMKKALFRTGGDSIVLEIQLLEKEK